MPAYASASRAFTSATVLLRLSFSWKSGALRPGFFIIIATSDADAGLSCGAASMAPDNTSQSHLPLHPLTWRLCCVTASAGPAELPLNRIWKVEPLGNS